MASGEWEWERWWWDRANEQTSDTLRACGCSLEEHLLFGTERCVRNARCATLDAVLIASQTPARWHDAAAHGSGTRLPCYHAGHAAGVAHDLHMILCVDEIDSPIENDPWCLLLAVTWICTPSDTPRAMALGLGVSEWVGCSACRLASRMPDSDCLMRLTLCRVDTV